MASRKLYFESIRLGDELPALAKSPIDRVQLARYAGASGDYNPIHVDEVYAKGLGMPSVYAPGMLVMGFLGQLVTDWARGAQLRHYQVRFVKMVWPSDTVVCKGRVTDRHGENGRYFAELDLWAENQEGKLVMKGQAKIQVFYSLEDENRQRAGHSAIVVNVPRESLRVAPPSPPPASLAPPASESKPASRPAEKAPAAKKPAPAAPAASAPKKAAAKPAAAKPAKKKK